MTDHQLFEMYLEQLSENAAREYRKTEQYRLLDEQLQKKEQNLQNHLNEEQCRLMEEWMEGVNRCNAQEMLYLYHFAFCQCTQLLRIIGVL